MCRVQRVEYACGCVHTDKITECENRHSFNESSHHKVVEKKKIMTMDCRNCLLAKKAKEREEIAAVHTAVDKSTTHRELAKEKEKKAAVHTAVDKLTSHPRPTKKVRWEEASK
jgi:hypothetical protein